MATHDTLPAALREEFAALMAPLVDAARHPGGVRLLMQSMGRTDELGGRDELRREIERLAALAQGIADLDPDTLDSWSGIGRLLALADDLFKSARGLDQLVQDPGLAGQVGDLGRDLVEQMLAMHLRARHPTLFRAACLLTLVTPAETAAPLPMVVDGSKVVRLPWCGDRLQFERVEALLDRPQATLSEHYFPNRLDAAADAHESARRLWPLLRLLAHTLGLKCFEDRFPVGTQPPPSSPPELNESDHFGDDEAGAGALAVEFPPVEPVDLTPYLESGQPRFVVVLPGQVNEGIAAPAQFAVAARVSSARHPGAARGLIIELLGQLAFTETRDGWKLTLESEGSLPAFVFGPEGVALAPNAPTGPAASARLRLEREAAPGAPAFVLGASTGTRLEVGALQLGADLSTTGSAAVVALNLDARSGALVVAPDDGFLSSVVPAEGLRLLFDLGLGWSSVAGLALRGSAGLNATLPVGRSIGPLTLSALRLALRVQGSGLTASITADMAAAIGPVRALIADLGLEATLTFPSGGGNLGMARLDVGPKLPSGIGLKVEAGGVITGGGFLFRDAARGLYAGALELSLHEQVALKAVGLIATKLADGSAGYSLVVFITAEGFRPVPLGLGFTLQGVGGMVAVNRTFDVEVLRRGLNDGTTAGLLFPRDPVGNAPALIRALDAAFPARRGAYLLGLLVRIGWGSPTLVQLDLALILEFGARRRLLLLGRLSSLLPTRENDLLRLQMDALGVIDFDEGTAEVDAVLVDSKLAQRFAISGTSVLRARWGSSPAFLLAAGGFHPRFEPPAGVPKMQRLAIALAAGDNPRLTCAAYFAVTANTVQFGANAQLYAAAAGFSVQGEVGFDVLIELSPLHFIAEFRASLQLKRGSRNLFKVSLAGELEGPRPLRISGKASFEILWCDFSVRFDKTLVAGQRPPPPPAVDAGRELARALAEPTSWRTASGGTHGVALRGLAAGKMIVLDPLGRLQVRQQVVPLNTSRDIERFGAAPLSGARRFQLAARLEGQATAVTEPLREEFAPAQYFEMSEDEKLGAPSFEPMDSGIVFGTSAPDFDAGELIAAPLEYEQIVVDEPPPEPVEPRRVELQLHTLNAIASSGAASRAAVRTQGRARFRSPVTQPFARLEALRYEVVPLAGEAAPAPRSIGFAESRAALTKLNRAGARWQAVPVHELAP